MCVWKEISNEPNGPVISVENGYGLTEFSFASIFTIGLLSRMTSDISLKHLFENQGSLNRYTVFKIFRIA